VTAAETISGSNAVSRTIQDTTYRVREALETEFEAVGRLSFEGFGHHLPGVAPPAQERLVLLTDAAARARDGILLVAENGTTGQLVGTASLLPFGSSLARQAEPGEMELRLLAVLPQARRSGIGWMLVEEAARLASAAGAHRLILDTALDNERSQALYLRFGFHRRPEREKPRPAPKVPLVVFTLDLSTTR
jgi:ribosomal protein S18 acetylase RimI-like enzyme